VVLRFLTGFLFCLPMRTWHCFLALVSLQVSLTRSGTFFLCRHRTRPPTPLSTSSSVAVPAAFLAQNSETPNHCSIFFSWPAYHGYQAETHYPQIRPNSSPFLHLPIRTKSQILDSRLCSPLSRVRSFSLFAAFPLPFFKTDEYLTG